MATLVTKRLADKLLHHAKGPTELPQEQPAVISCRELSGLQYLAGYVVYKFMKKAKYNMKCNNNNQQIIAVLQTFVSEDWSERKLISSQNRGGLTTVNNDIEKIFYRTEEEFRAETNSQNCINKIDINGISKRLIKNSDIISLYNSTENNGLSVDAEIKVTLLENKLYLRV